MSWGAQAPWIEMRSWEPRPSQACIPSRCLNSTLAMRSDIPSIQAILSEAIPEPTTTGCAGSVRLSSVVVL